MYLQSLSFHVYHCFSICSFDVFRQWKIDWEIAHWAQHQQPSSMNSVLNPEHKPWAAHQNSNPRVQAVTLHVKLNTAHVDRQQLS